MRCTFLALILVPLFGLACQDSRPLGPEFSAGTTVPSLSAKGNGSPTSPLWAVDIMGVPETNTGEVPEPIGDQIIVPLGSKENNITVTTRVELVQSVDGRFQVLDANGTDGRADFLLPKPGTYTIWARAVGEPGGEAKMTTCGESLDLGVICSKVDLPVVRGKGAQKFRDVTPELTEIMLDPNSEVAEWCGTTTPSLFHECLVHAFWSYDNTGLELLQLRFYPLAP